MAEEKKQVAENATPDDVESQERNLSEQQRVRREKLTRLQAEGRDPFAIVTYDQRQHSKEIKEGFESFEGKDVSIAGRMMSFRDIGKAAFADLQDRDGRIQIYANAEILGAEEYARFKTYDMGDIIGVKGKVFKTRRGEISVEALGVTLLAKALEPLPEKIPWPQGPGDSLSSTVSRSRHESRRARNF